MPQESTFPIIVKPGMAPIEVNLCDEDATDMTINIESPSKED